MGTTLTGLTPATTYDALIKVTDNGPLGGSLKTLTDGLGNDSALALSTGAASVTGTLSVSSNLTLSGYGSGTKTGTAAYNLAVDSSGNVIETAGGVVDGSGTANYVSKWSDPNTLTNSLIFDNGTNVGIGTTNPSYKLDVSGSARVNSTSNLAMFVKTNSAFGAAISYEDSTTGGNDVISAGAIGSDFYISTNFSERMRITSAGNVGIGTTSPATKLDIAGAHVSSIGLLRLNSSAGNVSAQTYYIDGAYKAAVYASTDNNFFLWGRDGDTVFSTTVSNTERMRITAAGNVGIGTNNPTVHSGGNALVVAGKSGVGSGRAIIELAETGGGRAVFQQVGSSTYIGNIAGNGPLILLVGGSGSSATEAVYINNSGNVGIGTSSPAVPLDVVGNIRSSTGILFGSDTAAANALDDYEEGTFTPTFTPSSGAYGTLTYGTTNGKYTKIGNRVDFSLRVTITAYSAGSASGNLRVGNLPFTCVASYVGSVSMSLVDGFAATRYPIKGFINDTTNYILLRYMTALNTNEAYVGATDITASSTIRISGTYFTA